MFVQGYTMPLWCTPKQTHTGTQFFHIFSLAVTLGLCTPRFKNGKCLSADSQHLKINVNLTGGKSLWFSFAYCGVKGNRYTSCSRFTCIAASLQSSGWHDFCLHNFLSKFIASPLLLQAAAQQNCRSLKQAVASLPTVHPKHQWRVSETWAEKQPCYSKRQRPAMRQVNPVRVVHPSPFILQVSKARLQLFTSLHLLQ